MWLLKKSPGYTGYFIVLESKKRDSIEDSTIVEVLSVEITCLCRLLIYIDNDFHLNLGFKLSLATMVFTLNQDLRKCNLYRQWF